MGAVDKFFEVVRPPINSAITLQHFIRCRGGVVPEWVTGAAKPFDGAIPAGRPVWEVDVAAEMAERAEVKPPTIDRTHFEENDAIQYLRKSTRQPWSQQDFDQRDGIVDPKFPKAFHPVAGAYGVPDMTRVVWMKTDLDAWIVAAREKIATLQRLVGSKR